MKEIFDMKAARMIPVLISKFLFFPNVNCKRTFRHVPSLVSASDESINLEGHLEAPSRSPENESADEAIFTPGFLSRGGSNFNPKKKKKMRLTREISRPVLNTESFANKFRNFRRSNS